MTEVLDREQPQAADQQLVGLHQMLAGLLREAADLQGALITLDEEDAANFADDGPDAQQRQRRRLATDAALRQLHNRIEGAKAAVAVRESELIAEHVERTRLSMNEDIDAMERQVVIASDALTLACRALIAIGQCGRQVVQRYRSVRGRSTLTESGHIAGGQITAIADPENLKFVVERHLMVHLLWRTDHGAHPAELVDTLGGQLGTLRGILDTLLESPEFADRQLPQLRAQALGGTPDAPMLPHGPETLTAETDSEG